MKRDDIRRMCIALLDDNHGINEEAYVLLSRFMIENGFSDLLRQVETIEGRFFLPEEE